MVSCWYIYMPGFKLERYNAILASVPRFSLHPVAVVCRNILLYLDEKTPNVPAAYVLCNGDNSIATV